MRTKTWIVLLAAAALSAGPVGTESPPESASPPAETAVAAEEDDEGLLEEFIPSEEVPADSAIAFPVDI
jgi:hypothetical protein